MKFNKKPTKCYVEKSKTTGKSWCKCRFNHKNKFSLIRSIKRGGTLIRVGCPKGKLNKKGKCRVSMKTQSIWRRDTRNCSQRAKK